MRFVITILVFLLITSLNAAPLGIVGEVFTEDPNC